MIKLFPLPLTAELFAPFGEVIEEPAIDDGSKPDRRFNDLASLDAGLDGRVMLSILRMRSTIQLPYELSKLECHPLGSQAFVPCSSTRFLVVVAPAGSSPELQNLRAFITDGRQGINYHKGIWHAPMATLTAANFLVIDRSGPGNNCEVFPLTNVSVTNEASV